MKKNTNALTNHLSGYLDWIDVEKGLSETTQENYQRFIQQFFKWLQQNDLSDLKPHELDEDHLWNYRTYLAREAGPDDDGLKRSTQQYYLIGLRSLLRYFARRDIQSLPPEKVELPKDTDSKEVRFLTMDQLKRLFKAPDTSTKVGLRDRAILETLFSTGMRVSELTDLDLNQVKSSLDNDDGLEISIVGKGSKARTVYFSPRALTWLRKYIDTRTDAASPLFVNFSGPKNRSRRLTPRSIQRKVKKYATEAGLPTDTTPHVLRHTFATDLLSEGVDIRVLQEFLGHESITATQIYTHVTSKQLKDIHSEFHSGKDMDEGEL